VFLGYSSLYHGGNEALLQQAPTWKAVLINNDYFMSYCLSPSIADLSNSLLSSF
jgi:hypothetical protein